MISDIIAAENRLLVAVGFFTDEDILREIRNNNKVKTKRVILNKADLDRDNEEGTEPIGLTWAREKLYVVTLGSFGGRRSNNMHHKFAIIDNKLWVGTFNFTIGATIRNWECMFRIDDIDTLQQFVDEFYIMYRMGMISNELPNGTKIVKGKEVLKTVDLIRDTVCTLCNQPIYNSHEHYIFEENHHVQHKLSYNYVDSKPKEFPDINETFFKAKCLGQQGVLAYSDKNCDVCGKHSKGFTLTKCNYTFDYVNDGSSAFYDAYDPSIHIPECTTSYKCPECFVGQTNRYLHFELWEPGQKFPEYR